MQKHKYAYINSKFFSPFLSIINKGVKKQTNNKDVYAIYIHEEEDAKLASLHTRIT